MNMRKIPILSDETKILYESPSPNDIYCYSPGLTICPTGRLITTFDLGGSGVSKLKGIKAKRFKQGSGSCTIHKGKIFVSDDKGANWRHIIDYPMLHARPFIAGKTLYIIGHSGDLGIMRSDDWGENWSEVNWLTQGQSWHQAPCNVWCANEKIYLVMERYVGNDWFHMAPVVMSGQTKDNLLLHESWNFSNELCFSDAVDSSNFKYFGIPFLTPGLHVCKKSKITRAMPLPGWLESNIVQFSDPNHVWFDPDGRTLHLWMRANTGSTNMACIAKVIESPSGEMSVMLEKSPSGVDLLFVPCPGGHMKFHIVYDQKTSLFWLVSTQSFDSMTRPDSLNDDRYNLPNDERHRLALYFSKNCIDWCFAGLVAKGDSEKQSRHYPSMAIYGDDLCVLSRSGDQRAVSAHNVNLITFHKIKNFRKLVY